MRSNRTDRIEESREFSERDAKIRKSLKMIYNTDYAFDLSKKPDHVDYYNAAYKIGGVIDFNRVRQLMDRGWTYVPPERHPELVTGVPEHMRENKGFIDDGFHILMERDKKYGELQAEMNRERNLELMMKIPFKDNWISDPRTPMRVDAHQTSMVQPRAASFQY